jgi:DNA-binding transcriptional MerR regulator
MKDILVGLKLKFVKPILEDNNRTVSKLEDFKEREELHFQQVLNKINELEKKIDQCPVLILEAIRNAIEQAGEN